MTVAKTEPSPAAAAGRLAGLSLPGSVRRGAGTAEPVARVATGVAVLDALTAGGFPRGRISEVAGRVSAGRTAVVLAVLAAATRRGEVVAWVDCGDALHPASALRAGVDLQRLLWVRPTSLATGLRCAEALLHTGGLAVVVLDPGDAGPRVDVQERAWLRLLRAAEQSQTACVVCGRQRMAGSFAALGIELERARVWWRHGVWPLFDGFEVLLQVVRNRLGPPGGQARLGIGVTEPGP